MSSPDGERKRETETEIAREIETMGSGVSSYKDTTSKELRLVFSLLNDLGNG